MKTQIIEDKFGRRVVSVNARTSSGGATDAKVDHIDDSDELSDSDKEERRLQRECSEDAIDTMRCSAASMQE